MKRVLYIDIKGITGKKIEYSSYPLKFSTCFGVQLAGKFMSSPEFMIYQQGTDAIIIDLSKSQSDI